MKRIKTSVKLLLVFGFILLGISIFGTTKVNAAVNTDTLNSALPDEVTLDITEVEYEKAQDMLIQKVKDIFKEKNFDYEGLNINVLGTDNVYLGKDYFHTFTVYLYNQDGSTHYTSKEIKLTYSNTKNYNSADEKAVKSIKLPNKPEYFVLDFNKYSELIAENNAYDTTMKLISEYYQNQYNDPTVKFIASTGLGDWAPMLFDTENLQIAIFKNGVLYDVRSVGTACAICEIIIPDNVGNSETDYINYAKPLIEKVTKKTVTIKKGIVEGGPYSIDIEDAYTITDSFGYVILKKAKVENVDKQDNKTGIKLESSTDVVPANTVLEVKSLENGNTYNTVKKSLSNEVSKFVLYDITLKQDNVTIQPSGKVKISIPIPSGFDKSRIVVYRIAEDGTKTEYTTKIVDNYIIFETDHFSNYVVAETTNPNTTTPTEQTKPDTTTPSHKLDETPKTGEDTNIIATISSILSTVSLAGIAIIKKF